MIAHRLTAVVLAGAIILAMTRVANATSPDPIAAYRGRSRVLLVSAPSASDPALQRQRALFGAMGAEARERDMVLLEAVGATGETERLRTAFGLDPAAFQAVLIGKDGGAKLRSPEPLGPDQLFPTIDAMPMRQEQMRRHRP